tara:strand:+ start:3250 stop:3558 length:309 start_codon:yes stop_codon:yes gene_type:complete
MTNKKKNKPTKGADAGTMYAYEKNPHEVKEDVKPNTKKVTVVDDKVATKVITNAYNANFGVIDDTIEEIKKESRRNGCDDYSCNNIYIILQDALKKVKLAGY